MRVLFISGELIAGDLPYRLSEEGCDVKLFIAHPEQQDCQSGFVTKIDDWRSELDWIGKSGLIVFDDVGFGEIQDQLRRDGFRVFGGSAGGEPCYSIGNHCAPRMPHYPRRLINSACELAMTQGVYSYGHVKTLTEQLMQDALALLDAPNPSEAPLTQSHALIRAGNDYADLFTLGARQSATLASIQAPARPQNQVEATQ